MDCATCGQQRELLPYKVKAIALSIPCSQWLPIAKAGASYVTEGMPNPAEGSAFGAGLVALVEI